MQIEILALRHQLAVLQRRTNKRASLRTTGRARRVICYMIEIAFTADRSISELGKWAFAKC